MTNARHAVWDADRHQGRAIYEGIEAYARHTIRDADRCHVGT